jgi:hypothetical protein
MAAQEHAVEHGEETPSSRPLGADTTPPEKASGDQEHAAGVPVEDKGPARTITGWKVR